jgi:hypothetical protein
MNWKQMKEFANGLSDEQLEKDVILWREESAISKIDPDILKEDHYFDEKEDEGCYTLSEAGISIEEAQEKGLKKVYDKGDPILFENV